MINGIFNFLIRFSFIKKIYSLLGKNLYYIGTFTALPPPLSQRQESKYILLLKDGNKEAEQKLIEHNLRLVVYIAKRFETQALLPTTLFLLVALALLKLLKHLKQIKTLSLRPMLRDVSKTKYLCF